ncbi:unnamed protein product [Toxocara canis]|uniref:Late endosomal/lysosomal adaptor and MAPK and MTOR activator 5 n=1 Tax=Toxocara canis TaxID=6265 RepID=A0A183V9P6_TOXCA|nr:unnamed protein product [Toxocara canis]
MKLNTMLEACSGLSASVASGFVLVTTEQEHANVMCAATSEQMYIDGLCKYLRSLPTRTSSGDMKFAILCETAALDSVS